MMYAPPLSLHDIIHKGLSENSVPPKSTVQPVFSLFNYAILCSIFRQPKYIIKYHMGAKRELPKTAWFKLDDGWPESVEEQSLLLLVWRHYITR